MIILFFNSYYAMLELCLRATALFEATQGKVTLEFGMNQTHVKQRSICQEMAPAKDDEDLLLALITLPPKSPLELISCQAM
jgi:hypothetical protein